MLAHLLCNSFSRMAFGMFNAMKFPDFWPLRVMITPAGAASVQTAQP